MLLNHVSHDVDGPFRTAYAIYVRKDAGAAASYHRRGAALSRPAARSACAASMPRAC